ncbi:uncharacterized protein GLRG_09054 [Colletotrichum graminicola M1.001]|uniref:Apple domain-containing protein n=1 Tax=Colletotrichum graminicola (strain M1.001 / M2 / FGSC 10212) TaxID=645133 RepID=E3QSS2_COLGM|nr:uncharacterized protein GLRG_09054 [Colletotrichum graminicola M1.001]EFQ33910.1 hypothetical protein GLRG_09054 [Colletotrichum graminicola M1.001]
MPNNTNGAPSPKADAVPDGLEVNTGVDYSTAPQAYQSAPTPQQPYNGYDQHYHAHTPLTNQTETTYTDNNHYNHDLPTSEKRRTEDGTICGLRKPTFWLIILSSLLFCALIGVAGGLGAMLANKDNEIESLRSLADNSTSATPTASPTASPTTSPTVLLSLAFDLSQPAETGTPIGLNKCPGSGALLTYEVPGTNLTFSKDCGTDYLYNDIAQVPAKNFEECVRYCAAFNLQQQSRRGPCRGVVYIFLGEQGEDANWCWMKYNKNTAQKGAKDYTESAWIM